MSIRAGLTPPSLDLVALGECLVEMYRRDDGAFTAGVSGDVFNTLFYAARLGARTGLVSALGNDPFTTMLAEAIAREGINTNLLLHVDDRTNGIYFIELDNAGEYTFHFRRSGSAATQTLLLHDLHRLAEYIADARFFLLTGIAAAVMESQEHLQALLEAVHGRTRVVFDTNYRARLWHSPQEYRARMELILPFVDIFLPSAGDLGTVYGTADADVPLLRLAAMGPSITLAKDGARGWGLVYGNAVEWHAPAEQVHVLDATGAGDAFNAGVLAGLCRGMTIEESARLGDTVARRVLRVRGAIDPTFEE